MSTLADTQTESEFSVSVGRYLKWAHVPVSVWQNIEIYFKIFVNLFDFA
jgi:hypothetical protein